MEIIDKEQFLKRREEFVSRIRQGEVFIHPTDTIYGIGCNASNSKSVNKIRKAKGRPSNPFSVIAPSKNWILENCKTSKEAEEYINKLPGAYTLILKLKNNDIVAKEVNPKVDSLGIRIPEHWFSKVVEELNIPVVTTSANLVGAEFMTSLENLDESIKSEMGFIIYEGEKESNPSTIVDLTGKKAKIINR